MVLVGAIRKFDRKNLFVNTNKLDSYIIWISKVMNIVVLATASRIGGAQTIYRQFLSHLQDEIGQDHYYVFINESMPRPIIPNVEYYVMDTTSSVSRIKFDFYQGKRFIKSKGLEPDAIVSLQNTGLFNYDIPQIIYYHQSIPLYPQSWSLLKKEERPLFFYKYIYPFFVKATRNTCTHYVVQIPFIKKRLVEKFNIPTDMVFTMFPDVEKINIESVASFDWGDDNIHFLYPANGSGYKMHITLINALKEINNQNIKLHLSFPKGRYPLIDKKIKESGLDDSIIREGEISHQQLLSMYKASAGLLFPSTIETIGLPLLEAAAFGCPIIAADVDYAHQVLKGYEGSVYLDPHDVNAWVENIQVYARNHKRYNPIKKQESSWPQFFELVRNSIKE